MLPYVGKTNRITKANKQHARRSAGAGEIKEINMSDLIDRQAAIVALGTITVYKGSIPFDTAMMRIEQLPPANCSEFPNNSDTISRQAAIEAVMECYDNDELFEVYEEKLRELPPAQSEIVRCKNCKHWIPYDWMFSEVWQSKNIADYPEDEIGCNYCDMTMKANDFCSRGERRTE